MKIRIVLLLAAMALSQAAPGVQKCVTPGGDAIFTDRECLAGSQPAGTTTYQFTPSSGLRPAEREMLEKMEAREAADRDAKRYAREREARHHVGHSDRLKIRELEMKKGSLSKSLTRGSKSYSEAQAIRAQIIGIDRQIEQIRSPRW